MFSIFNCGLTKITGYYLVGLENLEEFWVSMEELEQIINSMSRSTEENRNKTNPEDLAQEVQSLWTTESPFVNKYSRPFHLHKLVFQSE